MSDNIFLLAKELASFAQFSYQRGWSPATSTNFSARWPHSPVNEEYSVLITRSGIDKRQCKVEDILWISKNGIPFKGHEGKPSAETPLHLALYAYSSVIGSVLHTHSVAATMSSRLLAQKGKISFSNFEVLKGLAGTETHETTRDLPIFPNTQDMVALGNLVKESLQNHSGVFGVLIEGHGLYAWGKNLEEARRHVEVYEFLLECYMRFPW